MGGAQALGEGHREPPLEAFALAPDRGGIGRRELFGEISLARQDQQFAAHQIVKRRIVEHGGQRAGERLAAGGALAVAELAGNGGDEMAHEQALQSLVAGERIVIVRGEEHQIGLLAPGLDRHRRGEAAIERKHRRGRAAGEGELGFGAIEHHQLLAAVPPPTRACTLV